MKLRLDVFEGPLDLLLYLIKKDGLEISRVSIARIAEQYLEYLETMQELNIDVASEFLVMAAELAQIKSKALLPRAEDEESEDEGASGDLLAKLKTYQRYKTLAERLNARRLFGRDVFGRGAFVADESVADAAAEPEAKASPADEALEIGVYDLVRAFNEMLKRLPKARREHRVIAERVSVTERIYEIVEELKRAESVLFEDLFRGHVEKVEYIVTFLAVLEMAKLRLVRVFQAGAYAPIRLQRAMTEADAPSPEATDDIAAAVTYK